MLHTRGGVALLRVELVQSLFVFDGLWIKEALACPVFKLIGDLLIDVFVGPSG